MLLLARKRDIFKKEYNSSRHAQSFGPSTVRQVHRPWRPYKGTIILSGYSTPKTQYTRGLHGRLRVIVLFSLLKVSKFQVEDKSKTQRVYPCSALFQLFLETKKRRGVECVYLLEAFDCPQRINANNSRPKRSCGIKQKPVCHVAKRCGKQKPVADVSVRLILVAEIVEVSSRGQEKTLFVSKYRLFRCQKVSLQPRGQKKAQKCRI